MRKNFTSTIKVKEIPFVEAVERIMGQAAAQPPVFVSAPKQEKPKELLLPRVSRCATPAANDLSGRGFVITKRHEKAKER